MNTEKTTLMKGVSGVRGVVGETLTPELISRLGTAFGTYLNGGRVVIARDTRVSGIMLKYSVLGGLLSTGCEVIDLDIVPTPTCSLMVRELKAQGAIIITGSHNPVEWNALKFLKNGGLFINAEESKRLFDIFDRGNFKKVRWNGLRTVKEYSSGLAKHLKALLANIDVKLIRKQKFKVVIDSCNGAGSIVTPLLLKELGCKVFPLDCVPNGLFPHNPEPIYVNLRELCGKVKAVGADAGFAQDSDADRLAIVDADGSYIGEEYSVSLAADYLLKNTRNAAVVVNMSTSMAMDDIAKRHGARLIRTKVGEVHVAERMLKEKALIGGEGNGGVMWPKIHPVRDSLAGIALTLQNMADNKKSLKKLAGEIPRYFLVKEKIICTPENILPVMAGVKKIYAKDKVETVDGITITRNGVRMSIRPSNTEPILRIFVESKDLKISETIALDLKIVLAGLIKRSGN